MFCESCGKTFFVDEEDDDRTMCIICEARDTREHAPELIADVDWCKTCDTPIGHGNCDGCFAAACACEYDEDHVERCVHCGKDKYEFSDIGCAYCDTRHPAFGTGD